MESLEKTPPEFSKNLFWDADPDDLNFDKQARWVIARVVMRGSMNDWRVLKKFYGLDRIRREIVQVKYLDDVSLNFLAWFFRTDKTQFRCYTEKQLNPIPFDFF